MLLLIRRNATGKRVLSFIVPAIAVYFTMLFWTLPKVASFAPAVDVFDLSPAGYSFDHALKLLDQLGNDGRNFYLFRQIPLDLLYPGLFAISCSLLLAWILSKVCSSSSKAFAFCYIPIAAGFFDYLENYFIVRMLLSYPDLSAETVSIASTMTIAKSTLTMVFFGVLIVATLAVLIRTFNSKRLS